MVAKRSEIYWVALDPAVGSEIQKTRPCVVVSPDELNARVGHVIVAPLTRVIRPVRYRVTTTVSGQPASVALDQLRTVDRTRLVGRLAKVDSRTMLTILATLQAMFAP